MEELICKSNITELKKILALVKSKIKIYERDNPKKTIADKVYTKEEMMTSMKNIINIFDTKIKGTMPSTVNSDHDGCGGHYLEKMMDISHNASNSPDIGGFEMKKGSLGKISFGDWTPDLDNDSNNMTNDKKWWTNDIKKEPFMKKYGKYNKDKKRWSWSMPIYYEEYNNNGQKFTCDMNNNILVVYNKTKDKNLNDREQNDITQENTDIIIFGWSSKIIKQRVENKFGKNGYFICRQNKKKVFNDINFYEPILFNEFLKGIKDKLIYLDPGTKMGDNRPYMSWRANIKWWNDRSIINSDIK